MTKDQMLFLVEQLKEANANRFVLVARGMWGEMLEWVDALDSSNDTPVLTANIGGGYPCFKKIHYCGFTFMEGLGLAEGTLEWATRTSLKPKL